MFLSPYPVDPVIFKITKILVVIYTVVEPKLKE